MSDADSFSSFLRRVRAGDAEAAAELVRRYEPLVRRAVRLQLEDRRLRRLFDSSDVCQSVLASFFARAAVGQYDLDGPEQLVKLLVTMTKNKVASEARKQTRQRRDQRRVAGGDEALATVAGRGPTPSRHLAGRELLARFREQLTEEERQVADLRAEGLGWDEVAARLGGTAQARRMQLSRATARVARDLGLDDDDA